MLPCSRVRRTSRRCHSITIAHGSSISDPRCPESRQASDSRVRNPAPDSAGGTRPRMQLLFPGLKRVTSAMNHPIAARSPSGTARQEIQGRPRTGPCPALLTGWHPRAHFCAGCLQRCPGTELGMRRFEGRSAPQVQVPPLPDAVGWLRNGAWGWFTASRLSDWKGVG
jgi:hypothetical protein